MKLRLPALWSAISLVPLLLVHAPSSAFAAWPVDPSVNVPVATGAREQVHPLAIPDGSGGALVAYEDYSGTQARRIYVQHMLASGGADPAWPPGGRLVPGLQVLAGSTRLIGDGAGGVIVAWTDDHLASQHYVSTAHLLANGAVDVTWLVNASTPVGNAAFGCAPAIATDGAGGAIVSWAVEVGFVVYPEVPYQLYSQHLISTGANDPAWPAGGRKVMGVGYEPFSLTSASDGAGGAFLAVRDLWGYVQVDPEHTPSPFYGVIAHHVLADGTADSRWTAGGIRLSSSSYSYFMPTLESDRHGGAWLTLVNFQVRPIRLNADGSWVGGVALPGNLSGTEASPIVVDTSGNAIFACARADTPILRAYRVRFGGTADPAWPANGRPLSALVHGMYAQCAAGDGADGAIVVWLEARGATVDLFAQHVRVDGTLDPSWPADGYPVTTAPGTQDLPAVVSDGQHGAIVAWRDTRSGTTSDIYAQEVDGTHFFSIEPRLTSVRDVAADEGGHLLATWNASDAEAPVNPIARYEVWRSIPLTAYSAARARGAATRALPAGANIVYWEYVGAVTAARQLSYSIDVPTECDSAALGNPRTQVFVEARHTDGHTFYDSAVDSGYSVDNLAPAAPSPFVGARAGGATHLHWRASASADIASYRLQRSATLPFPPAGATLLPATLDTSYVDVTAQPFHYRLQAVDIHGNWSEPLELSSGEMLGVEPGVLALSLSRPQPSPASSATLLRFALATAAQVKLAVFDASGRCVRTLLDGSRAAGEHAMSWDLRRDDGGAIAPGLYFVRLEAGGGVLSRRLAVVR